MKYHGSIAYRSNLHGQVSEGFLHSTVQAWEFLNREYREHDPSLVSPSFHFMRGLSVIPSESANAIADTFLGEWVLMLDTDHVFGADAFYEMIRTFEENQLDILVGFTQRRVWPYHPVIFRTDFDPRYDFKTMFPNPLERHALLPIDSSGAACLLVRRKVFDVIKSLGERPFDPRRKFHSFDLKTRELIYAVPVPEGRYNDETFAEDTSFFWRAHMLGIQAYCAPWVKFHHLATVLVDESMMVKK